MQKVAWIFVFVFVKVSCDEECGVLRNENEPPWNVGIYRGVRNDDLELVCLGTIVQCNVVVTAAHCLCDQSGNIRNEEFYISPKTLGKQIKQNRSLQKVEKRKIFKHSSYKGGAKNGDIAVLTLQNHLNNKNCIPICIDWDNTRPILEDGEQLRHPSWQKGNLKMNDISYVDFDNCYYLVSDFFRTFLKSDKICGKSRKVTTGEIDDGSGLIYFNFLNNLWYLRGVLSAHDPDKSNVSTYSNVILYLNWLSSISARL